MASHAPTPTRRTAFKRSAWSGLASHYNTASKLHLRQLFADDPKRGQRMAIEAVGLYLDYSKNRLTDETLKLLGQLAEESGLRSAHFLNVLGGGIDSETAPFGVAAGANVLVAGTSVFDDRDGRTAAMNKLRSSVEPAAK